MQSDDPIRRANRWKAFYEEDGGLRDMIAMLGQTYLERLSQVEPWETEKLSKLAMANRITQQLDGFVRSVMAAGDVATKAREHAERLEKLPHAKRRFL